jgi:hypothetical protein
MVPLIEELAARDNLILSDRLTRQSILKRNKSLIRIFIILKLKRYISTILKLNIINVVVMPCSFILHSR